MQLRCSSTMHAKLDGDKLKVRCRRRPCGAKRGVIVVHTFDLTTGKMVGTTMYADPIVKEDDSASR